MFRLSISCTSARPRPTATHWARISGSSASRSSGVSCLESFTPTIRVPGRNMLLFYDAHFSGNTYKVRLLLSQLRLPHEVVRLDLLRGEVRTPEFRKQNPFGRVPFVVDGEFALAESNAILLWLSRGTPLLPADERQQALVQQWMFFEQNQLELSVGIPRLARKIDLGLPREVLEWHFPRAVAALKVLERHLGSR